MHIHTLSHASETTTTTTAAATTTTRLDRFAFPLLCDLLLSPVVDMSLHGDHDGGAAKRRRDRRLRMHWRHEQLTLQMALAAALHHSRDCWARDVQRSTEPGDCQGGGHEHRSAEPETTSGGRGHRVLLAVRG